MAKKRYFTDRLGELHCEITLNGVSLICDRGEESETIEELKAITMEEAWTS